METTTCSKSTLDACGTTSLMDPARTILHLSDHTKIIGGEGKPQPATSGGTYRTFSSVSRSNTPDGRLVSRGLLPRYLFFSMYRESEPRKTVVQRVGIGVFKKWTAKRAGQATFQVTTVDGADCHIIICEKLRRITTRRI